MAEAGFEIVPEFHVFLIRLPAEKNFLAADDSRKINQPALQILDENLSSLKFRQQLLHVRQHSNPIIHRLAADVIPLLR